VWRLWRIGFRKSQNKPTFHLAIGSVHPDDDFARRRVMLSIKRIQPFHLVFHVGYGRSRLTLVEPFRQFDTNLAILRIRDNYIRWFRTWTPAFGIKRIRMD
jgi:hypothetical protein